MFEVCCRCIGEPNSASAGKRLFGLRLDLSEASFALANVSARNMGPRGDSLLSSLAVCSAVGRIPTVDGMVLVLDNSDPVRGNCVPNKGNRALAAARSAARGDRPPATGTAARGRDDVGSLTVDNGSS